MVGRSPGFKGYWADHQLKKPSVFRDVNEWEGWEKTMEKIRRPPGARDQLILNVLHQTGARVSELIQYGGRHFEEEDEYLKVIKAPLVKNKQLKHRWTFYIEKSEPPMERLLEFVDRPSVKEYLFPSLMGRRPYLSRQYVWLLTHNCLGLYPHWFRAQRAFCLTWYHDLDFEELRGWFTWLDPNTPSHYARPSPTKTAKKFKKFKASQEAPASP